MRQKTVQGARVNMQKQSTILTNTAATPVLMIASSARMMAQLAHQVGITVVVIDLFADTDTQQTALESVLVSSLSIDNLRYAVKYFINKYAITTAVYGSGFEAHAESLFYLAKQLTLCGNAPQIFANIQNKLLFFKVLTDANISYPEVTFTLPATNKTWLFKPNLGQGGQGIHYLSHQDDARQGYWQAYIKGQVGSVIFFAKDKKSQLIGFNTQWSEALAENDFVFSGIINHSDLPDNCRTLLAQWIATLTRLFCLQGINSMDFIYAKGQLYVLEINARIPASVQLYSPTWFYQHVINSAYYAKTAVAQKGFTAYQIVYAAQQCYIPTTWHWPENCVDLSEMGVKISKNQPICSIIATDKTPSNVVSAIQKQRQFIVDQLPRTS
ncbi:MAG: ATP-grasp domain-containing protein [Methylococcaceae bacterium]|nr:MAG: ATP-grasp domain-containing protein [Methylococcaceae bacterium]